MSGCGDLAGSAWLRLDFPLPSTKHLCTWRDLLSGLFVCLFLHLVCLFVCFLYLVTFPCLQPNTCAPGETCSQVCLFLFVSLFVFLFVCLLVCYLLELPLPSTKHLCSWRDLLSGVFFVFFKNLFYTWRDLFSALFVCVCILLLLLYWTFPCLQPNTCSPGETCSQVCLFVCSFVCYFVYLSACLLLLLLLLFQPNTCAPGETCSQQSSIKCCSAAAPLRAEQGPCEPSEDVVRKFGEQ